MFKLITRQTIADGAAAFWKQRIEKDKSMGGQYAERTFSIWSRIVELGKNPKPDKVDEIVGRDRWTYPSCSTCDRNVNEVVEVREGVEWEQDHIYLCRDCLHEALAIVAPGVRMLAPTRTETVETTSLATGEVRNVAMEMPVETGLLTVGHLRAMLAEYSDDAPLALTAPTASGSFNGLSLSAGSVAVRRLPSMRGGKIRMLDGGLVPVAPEPDGAIIELLAPLPASFIEGLAVSSGVPAPDASGEYSGTKWFWWQGEHGTRPESNLGS